MCLFHALESNPHRTARTIPCLARALSKGKAFAVDTCWAIERIVLFWACLSHHLVKLCL